MSNELLNKAITSCFAKIARVDGSIGKEEMDWSDLEIVEKIRETYQENLKIKQ